VLIAWVAGCNNGPGSVEKVATTSDEGTTTEMPPQQNEPALEDDKDEPPQTREGQTRDGESQVDAGKGEAPSEGTEITTPQELQLDGIRFVVPLGWKRVKSQNRVVEAEFELPRVEGDEYDGRLTLMGSFGDPQDAIAIRTAEFKLDPDGGPIKEVVKIAGVDATWVDFRGEWKGMSLRAEPMPPRADYRMLLVVIPFTERSAFYAKLTGPRSTIAAHEEEFREFLRSAKMER
jgi:hypothetical protein